MSHCLGYKHCVSMLPNSTTDLRNIKGNFPLDSSGSPSSGAYPNLRSMKRMLPLPPEVDASPPQVTNPTPSPPNISSGFPCRLD